MTAPALFPTCPLPGCANLTDDPRRPCPQCLTAFGDWLRPAATPVSEDDFAAAVAERDTAVRAVLAERRTLTTRTTAGAGQAEARRRHPAPADADHAEWTRNQTCWCCEQRRACRIDPDSPNGWICKKCLEIT
jgi:hypothetical protein